ncbi:MAG: hypothetical protein M1821_001192 [Bathelium mastoideum]|nr:MAG: hypothetical protein M1821_001192 [Bathelium mastoideum]
MRPIRQRAESFQPKRNPQHVSNGSDATRNGAIGSTIQDDEETPEDPAGGENPVSLSCTPGELLVAHSKVYTFAAQFLCSDLKELALQHLTQILKSADPKTSNILSGLLEAIVLVYDQTQEQASGAEPARPRLMSFLAKNLEYVDVAGALPLENQEIVRDLMQETLKRATTAERGVGGSSRRGTCKVRMIERLKKSRSCKYRKSYASHGFDFEEKEFEEVEPEQVEALEWNGVLFERAL